MGLADTCLHPLYPALCHHQPLHRRLDGHRPNVVQSPDASAEQTESPSMVKVLEVLFTFRPFSAMLLCRTLLFLRYAVFYAQRIVRCN